MGLQGFEYQPLARHRDKYAFIAWLAEQSHKRRLRREAAVPSLLSSYRLNDALTGKLGRLTLPYAVHQYPGSTAFLAHVLGYSKRTVERAMYGPSGDKRCSGPMARRASKWLRERAGLMLQLAADFDDHATKQEAALTEVYRAPGLRRFEAKLAKEGTTHPGRLTKKERLRLKTEKQNDSLK